MAVVTLGGPTGGGGRLLGPTVAQRLGADYVDRLILTDAARQIGATVEALHQRDERPPTRAERFSGMLQRTLERSSIASAGGDPYFGPSAMAFLTQEFDELPQPMITKGHELEDGAYVEAMQSVMNSLAERGSVVIVGRGGSIMLRDRKDVLRVCTVAHFEDRVARIVERERLGQEQAQQTVVARDKARQHYYGRYFGIDNPDGPELYHLVLNTSIVGADYATGVIVEASGALSEGRLVQGVAANT